MAYSKRSLRKATQKSEKRSGSSTIYWLVGAGVVMVGLIVFAVMLNSGATAGPIEQPDLPAEWLNGMSMGNPDAPITVEAYEDFLCPHCREWTETVKQNIFTEYIQTGDVRFEFHPFPLEGFAPGSRMAAQAAYCAEDQGYFWPYHDRLFAAQGRGQAGYMIEELLQYANDMGLDSRAFSQCMSALAHQDDILQTSQEGVSRGVTGTPSIFVNGQNVSSDYGTVKAEIDRLLAATGQ
ncbi:MAG: DsbA family protein [Caldilineaceae bacterium]|nr:DsbA family protein [Caldilineaceae bacterium]